MRSNSCLGPLPFCPTSASPLGVGKRWQLSLGINGLVALMTMLAGHCATSSVRRRRTFWRTIASSSCGACSLDAFLLVHVWRGFCTPVSTDEKTRGQALHSWTCNFTRDKGIWPGCATMVGIVAPRGQTQRCFGQQLRYAATHAAGTFSSHGTRRRVVAARPNAKRT